MLQFVLLRLGNELYVLPGGQKLDVSNDDMSEITPGEFKKSDLKKAFGKNVFRQKEF